MRWPWAKDPDVAASKAAAVEALREIHALKPEIDRLRDDLNEHQRRNHLVEKIEQMFRPAP